MAKHKNELIKIIFWIGVALVAMLLIVFLYGVILGFFEARLDQ